MPPNNAPPINFGTIGQPPAVPVKGNPAAILGSNAVNPFLGGLTGTASGGLTTNIPVYSPSDVATFGGNVGNVGINPVATNTTGGFSIPAGIIPTANAQTGSPNVATGGNGAPAPTPPQSGYGIKAPPGMEYGPDGNLRPIGSAPTPPPPGFYRDTSGNIKPLNSGAPAETNPSSQSSMSSLGNPNTYQDLLDTINKNITNYQTVAQQNQDELNAQQNLLSAIQAQQQLKTNVLGNQLGWYGRGVPQSLAQSEYQNVGFGAQVAELGAQNAVDIAQRGLQYQQLNRQVRAQAAAQAIQSMLGVAGLQRPQALYPGSSLVSPTGQVMYQGSGITAASPETVSSIANMLYTNGQFPDYATALQAVMANPSAYIPGMGGNAGSTAVSPSSGSTNSTMQGSNIFGYDMSSYSTNPNYGTDLSNQIQGMPQAMNTPNSIQSWIDQNYKNSPITGQMVYDASSTYGVSPKVLSAVLAQESQMATDGSAGAKGNNPGNWGNSDSAMAAGQPTNFASMQDGINHVASWLAQHHESQTGTPQSGGVPAGLNDQQAQLFNQARAMLPPQIAPALDSLSDGSLFLDQAKIPENSKNYAQSYSSKSGIPILTTDETGAARSADNAMAYLEQMRTAFGQIASPGLFGRIQGLTLNQLGNFFQSSPIYKQYAAFRDTAIRLIQGLAGGSGSGLRINQSEIDTQVGILPSISDNLESGNAAIDQVESFLQQKMKNVLPNYTPPSASAQTGISNADPLGILK